MLSLVPRILVIPDVEPRPAVESAALDVADVIRHQIVAELIAFVRAHPKLVRSWTKLNPDCIPDSPGENIKFRPGTNELWIDRKSTRLNSSHTVISYAVFCLKKKN